MTDRGPSRKHPVTVSTDGPWPIAERADVRDQITLGLERSAGALVIGDPGVGKTTLANEVSAAVERQASGQPVRWLRTPATLLATPWTALAPLLGFEDAPEPGVDEIARLIARCRDALDRLGDRPLLVVDDAHLLDDVTAVVVAELAQTAAVGVVATCRRQPGPPAAFVTLRRQNVLHQVDVAGLTYAQVEAVLETALAGPIARETSWRAWEATRGNPLYLRELTRSLRDAGSLLEVSGAWVWRGRRSVGRRLTDLIHEELNALDGSEREVVDLLALAGPTAVDDLTGTVDDAALTAGIDRGLVTLEAHPGDGVPRARLVHPVHVDVIRTTLPPGRRQRLYDRLSTPRSDTSHPITLFSTVDWALSCGVAPPTEDLIAAAHAADRVADAPLVRRLTNAALDTLPPTDPRATQLRLLRAHAARFSGDDTGARRDLQHVGDHLPPGPAGESVRWKHARALANLQQYGDDDIDAALDTLARVTLTDPGRIVSRDVDRLIRLVWAGDFGRGLPELLEFAGRPELPPSLRAAMLGSLIVGLAQAGRLGEALDLADEALTAWRIDSQQHPWLLGEVLGTRFLAALWIGDPERAMHPPHVHDQTARVDDAVVQVGNGRYHAARSEWGTAVDAFRGSLSRFALRDPSGFGPTASANLAYALAALGDREGSLLARRAYETTRSRASRVVHGDSEFKLAAAAVALGEADATERCAQLDTWATGQGLWLWALHARHLNCLLAAATGGPNAAQIEHLAAAARRVDGPIGRLMIDRSQALADGDTVLAGHLVGSLAELGVWIPEQRAVDLTPRQHEIAHLVRAGLSNREIAERLVVSVRTVDTHVGHIFERLGVNTRAAVGQRLPGPGERST